MIKGEAQMENQLSGSDSGAGDTAHAQRQPRRLVGLLFATSVLIIVAVAAYMMFGRELFQRPFLVVAVVIAWLGALVGISIGSEPG